MQNARQLLDQFLNTLPNSPDAGKSADQQGGSASGFSLDSLTQNRGSLATGAVAGGLLGLLLGGKSGRKMVGNVAKIGGAAVVAGLAYNAWQNWQAKKDPNASGDPDAIAPPADDRFMPTSDADQENLSRMLIRSMIAAAKADGHIDREEHAKIQEQLAALSLGEHDQSYIRDELARPLDVNDVIAGVKSPEEAAEIYAAALLAIDPTGKAEKAYLNLLAARLDLDDDLVSHLHASVEGATTTG